MKILVFDTETTWFINKKNSSLDAQPYIIQFAWIYWEIKNKNFNEIKRINKFFKPEVPIPYETSQIHHIYDIDVKNAPKIYTEIEEIIEIINNCDLIIWHNIEYDEEMLKIELKRINKEYLYNPKQVFCTMKGTVDFCKIKWNWEKFKYPKLWELYKILFWEYFVWAHDAMIDVEVTLKIFLELYRRNIIDIQKKEKDVLSLF